MTTRRGMFLTLVAVSAGAIGSASGLATAANAAPDPTPIEAAISGEVLNELRAENARLHAELERKKKTVEVLEKLNRHLRAKLPPEPTRLVGIQPTHLASSVDNRCVKCKGVFPCLDALRESKLWRVERIRQPAEA
jgi:hypothetical protein